MLPRTEVSLFIDDAPHQIRIEMINIRLTCYESIVPMDPILVEKIEAAYKDKDDEDKKNNSFHAGRDESAWRLHTCENERVVWLNSSVSATTKSLPARTTDLLPHTANESPAHRERGLATKS